MINEMVLPSEEELDQLSLQGWTIYQEKIKPIFEPQENGKVVVIHLDSGDYEVARTSAIASKAIRLRHPDGLLMVTDIGPAQIDGLTLRMMGWQGFRERYWGKCEGVNSSR